MKLSRYRDRFGELMTNIDHISGTELTMIHSVLTQYVLDNMSNENTVIKLRVELALKLKKQIES